MNRRALLRRAAMGSGWLTISGSLAFGASDFWNKKQASDLSPDEVNTLRNKSPWAKKVSSEVISNRAAKMDTKGRNFGGMASADGNGLSKISRGGGPAPMSPGVSGSQNIDVVVRWESAKPLLEATKVALPQPFENHYAVSISGLPLKVLQMALTDTGDSKEGDAPQPDDPAARQKAMVDHLLAATTLTPKGRPPVPSDLMLQSADKQSLIFAFQKHTLPLAETDKDVTFDVNLPSLKVKAKFELKDMLYQGTLAL
ncbi:MAG: hypothetical protein ABSB15_14560 [Bryobacteraceae bacterium]